MLSHCVFSVFFCSKSSLCFPPSHGSNDTFGFEASILALFLKSANSGGTDSLSASSRESAFTNQKQHYEAARLNPSGF